VYKILLTKTGQVKKHYIEIVYVRIFGNCIRQIDRCTNIPHYHCPQLHLHMCNKNQSIQKAV